MQTVQQRAPRVDLPKGTTGLLADLMNPPHGCELPAGTEGTLADLLKHVHHPAAEDAAPILGDPASTQAGESGSSNDGVQETSLVPSYSSEIVEESAQPADQQEIRQHAAGVSVGADKLGRLNVLPTASSSVGAAEAPGSAQRAELTRHLDDIKAHYSDLRQQNWSPDKTEIGLDRTLLPLLVAAENARKPKLNLQFFENFTDLSGALKAACAEGRQTRGRAIASLPGRSSHLVAVDYHVSAKGKVSVIIVDDVGIKKDPWLMDRYETVIAPRLVDALPQDAKLTVLSQPVQTSKADCGIFALATASKLSKNKSHFDDLHRDNLAGTLGSKPIGPAQTAPQVLIESGSVRVIDGLNLLPARLMKHVQARSTLESWKENRPTSKPGLREILTGRFRSVQQEAKAAAKLEQRLQDKLVDRYAVRDDKGRPIENPKDHHFSASIEDARLAYIDRALAHYAQAPEGEVDEAMSRLQSRPDSLPSNLQGVARTVGPLLQPAVEEQSNADAGA